MSIADFARSLGTGMTVKLFPLFFSSDSGPTPMHLCLLGMAYNLSVVLFTFIAAKLSKSIGVPSLPRPASQLGKQVAGRQS